MNGERASRLSPWAVSAFVVGLAGVGIAYTDWLIPIAPAIAAILLARVAQRRIRRSQGLLRGSGLALAGYWLGWVGVGVRIVKVVVIDEDRWWLLAIMVPLGIAIALLLQSERKRQAYE